MSARRKPVSDSLRLIMESDLEEIERAVEEAEGFFSAHIQDEDFVYKLVLLTSEAVTNAIEHGNKLDPTKSVIVDFIVEQERLEVWVQDEGAGFRREDIRDPLKQENLLEDGGRGIYLMELMADEIIYEREGCRIGMFFYRPE